jgi:hypothetical protein
MANPSPQHTPTDGLGTATQITLTSNGAAGSALTTIAAGRLYSSAVSVSGATINGTAYSTGFTLTAAVKDVGGNAFTSGNSNSVVFKSYDTSRATVNSSTGVVASVAAGQVVLEASFPTNDTTDGVDKIYVQVVLNVYP